MKKILTAIAMVVGIGMVPATALAHHPLISGTPTCPENGTWSVTWLVQPDVARQDATWQIVSPSGYSPSGSQVADQPFTRTVTYPESQAVAWEVVTAAWSDGSGGRRAASVTRPAECAPPETTTTTTTTLPPPTTAPPTTAPPTTAPPTTAPPTTAPPTTAPPTTAPPTTAPPTTAPPTTAPPTTEGPGTTLPGQPETTTTTTTTTSLPTDTGGGGSTPTGGTPDNGGPTGDLPQTGSDLTANLLTIAIVLMTVGGLIWVRASGKSSSLLDS